MKTNTVQHSARTQAIVTLGTVALLLALTACSGGSGDTGGATISPGAGGGGGVPTGTLVIRQDLEQRAVAIEIDSVRIFGTEGQTSTFETPTEWLYGPVVLPKQGQYILDDVPVTVKFVRVEYLQDLSVRGVFTQAVEIQPGQAFEIVDPNYEDLAGLFERVEVHNFGGQHDPFRPAGEPEYLVAGSNRAAPAVGLLGFATEGGQGIELTGLAFWESSDPSVLRINNPGQPNPAQTVLGQPGLVTITGRFIDLEAQLLCEVFYAPEPNLIAIELLQAGAGLPQQTTVQLTALGRYSDDSVRNLTSELEWSVHPVPGVDPDTITLDPQVPGLATTADHAGLMDVRMFDRSQRFVGYSRVHVVE